MRLHITNSYGISGSSATSVAMHSVAKIASEFAQDAGLEVSIYKYPSRVDNVCSFPPGMICAMRNV